MGMCNVATVLPDAQGWDACKALSRTLVMILMP